MKVVFCWSGMSGYMAACWRALGERSEVNASVLVALWSMPWAKEITEHIPDFVGLTREEVSNSQLVEQLVLERNPDIIVICGWACSSFVRLAFNPKLRNVRFIMAMDTPWRGTWRQWLAPLKLRRLVARIDAVFVTGERCWQYARHLGFNEAAIRRGTYGIDYAAIAPARQMRLNLGEWPKRFLFIGRYSPEKGIQVLVEAYRRYRSSVPDPWPLAACGGGELATMFAAQDGIEDLGFTQPAQMTKVLSGFGVFLLASTFDPWPLVIVESCAAGLPILCTEACGSAVELVRPYYSGLTAATGDASSFARGMLWMHQHYNQLPEMGERAQQFAAAYSAQAWAERWTALFRDILTP